MNIGDLVRALLPKNATALERASVETLLERIDEIALVTSSIWNPYECPAALLPLLAWAHSVDVWQDSWTEETKRKVIAAAPIVHRKKGTTWALEHLLSTLNVETQFVEWWETVPAGRRGTFDVLATYRAETGLKEAPLLVLEKTIRQFVRVTKPKSRAFELAMTQDIRTPAKPMIGFGGWGHIKAPVIRMERPA